MTRARLLRRSGLVVVTALIVVIGVLTWRWFVRPSLTADPYGVDAVVMLGGRGERFVAARALAEGGAAPVLVLSDPSEPGQPFTPFGWFCNGQISPQDGRPAERGYEAICFDPHPQTTRGEARAIGDLADARGWRSITVVSTIEQASRARRVIGRCFDGEIRSVGVPTTGKRSLRIAYEWAATIKAAVLTPTC